MQKNKKLSRRYQNPERSVKERKCIRAFLMSLRVGKEIGFSIATKYCINTVRPIPTLVKIIVQRNKQIILAWVKMEANERFIEFNA